MTQEPDTRRDHILSAVVYATSELLRSVDWKSSLNGVLEQLGKAATANRAYYFENRVTGDSHLLMSQLAEWVAPGIEPQIGNPDLQDLCYIDSGFIRWVDLMQNREAVYGLVSDFPEGERQILEPQDICSIIAMPVFSRDKWVGFLGFDDCENQREWSKAEYNALFASAEVLGAAIERQQLDHELRFSQKMEAIGSLASGVAHDFNNVLQMIVGLAEIAKLKMEGVCPRSALEEITAVSQRASSLTRQLLVFANKHETAPRIIDLGELIASVATIVKTAGKGSVDLSIDVVDPSPKIFADPGLFSQVFVNLCLNACAAMPNGGRLDIRCKVIELSQVELGSRPNAMPGRYACCSVTDTGSGMEEAVCERIFEPFFTTKEIGKGTGLGLSVAHQTVRECGGFIDVESRLNVGTCFNVFVPVADEVSQPASGTSGATKEARATKGGETILVVEDEAIALEAMRQLLEREGFSVLTAQDGSEGLQRFRQNADSIDLVLTDFQLPHLDGFSMIHSIRKSHPAMKVIVLSGASDKGFPENCLFLRKPTSMAAPCWGRSAVYWISGISVNK